MCWTASRGIFWNFKGRKRHETNDASDIGDADALRLQSWWVNSCDAHGNIITQEAYDAEGTLVSATHRRIGTGTITGKIESLRTGRLVKEE